MKIQQRAKLPKAVLDAQSAKEVGVRKSLRTGTFALAFISGSLPFGLQGKTALRVLYFKTNRQTFKCSKNL